MHINRTGITRIVILTNRYAIKIPRIRHGWRFFLAGILANVQEDSTYKFHPRKDLLCPVIWCSWGGWVLVMQRTLPCMSKPNYSEWIENGLGGDDKPENYGVLGSKIVKIDYGQL